MAKLEVKHKEGRKKLRVRSKYLQTIFTKVKGKWERTEKCDEGGPFLTSQRFSFPLSSHGNNIKFFITALHLLQCIGYIRTTAIYLEDLHYVNEDFLVTSLIQGLC